MPSLSPREERVDAAVSDELEHIWSRVQAELALAVDESTYRIWLDALRARDLAGERLLIEAPPQACGWIRARFGRILQACAAAVLGPDVVLELVSSQDPEDSRPTAESERERLARSHRPEAIGHPRAGASAHR